MYDGPKPKKIDWDELFRWLEAGYLPSDFAPMVGLSVGRISKRATADLDADRLARWRELCQRNKLAIAWPNPIQCGTVAGYQKHVRDRTPKCRPCKDARTAETKRQRERKRAT